MSCQERAVSFSCQNEQLVGVLATPPETVLATGVGVVVVVGGPQYRAGAHRQFVQLARALAAAGHGVLRFDVRGMGDSTGTYRSFEELSDDIAAALSCLLHELPRLRHTVLFGLCDGASAALIYLHHSRDRRVQGLSLLNPWLRSEETYARTQMKHYYSAQIFSGSFWRRLLIGDVSVARRVREFFGKLQLARGAGPNHASGHGPSFQAAMAKGLAHFEGRCQITLCSNDLTAKEFSEAFATSPDWHAAKASFSASRLQVRKLEDADHTLSTRHSREAFEQGFLQWLKTREQT